jgi:hypothetical protein
MNRTELMEGFNAVCKQKELPEFELDHISDLISKLEKGEKYEIPLSQVVNKIKLFYEAIFMPQMSKIEQIIIREYATYGGEKNGWISPNQFKRILKFIC